MFRRPLVDVTIMEGLDAQFECETEEEDVFIQWFYNGEEITHSQWRENSNRHKTRTCTCTNCFTDESQDSGTFSININGNDTTVALIVKAGQEIQNQTEKFADCGFWDFAGQKEFYATHQTFLSANAVYLLVVDISKDFTTKTYNKMIEKEFDSIGGRHRKRKRSFKDYLNKNMSIQNKRGHLRKPHFLSNMVPSDSKQEFEELRNDIFVRQGLYLIGKNISQCDG
ncbi:unnamed protein product [Mytilus edulis]|uniref:Immunoglobulin I-set domain-containing protein n=1 Tax=Mytilus edulis TaxID=6550 RepID=A0A8S3QUP2_MYTED|nr:unnamed protein product [Mytilus edulis]